MARLIGVENCKNCPNVSRLTDWDSPHVTFSCSLRRDARGGYMEVPDPWAIPDWCPLEEATSEDRS